MLGTPGNASSRTALVPADARTDKEFENNQFSPTPQFIGEYPLRPVRKVWRDRSDRISVFRVVTLICLFSPLGKAIYDSDTIKLDARPITNLIHRTGDWALIFLLVALAARLLSRILRFNRLFDVRRMIGVGAFAYAAAHFTLYIFDLNFDWSAIASEIVHRNRLTL